MDLIRKFDTKQIKQNFIDIRPGDTVKVHQRVKETVVSDAKAKKKEKEQEKERIQIFEGVVLYVRGGKGMAGTFCVRKVSSGVGVERIFPIYSPNIVKIEVMRRGKARRAKLFFLRREEQKNAQLVEKEMSAELKAKLVFESEEAKKETEVKIKERAEVKKTEKAEREKDKKEKVAKKVEEKKAKKAAKTQAKKDAAKEAIKPEMAQKIAKPETPKANPKPEVKKEAPKIEPKKKESKKE